MQNSLMTMSQHQTNTNYVSHQFSSEYPRQENLDSFYATDPNHYYPWANFNRPTSTTSSTSTGYQSIIGRRRQMRYDDNFHDNTSVGNGYSSVFFNKSQNLYPITNSYMNLSDQPPAIPPRMNRNLFREQQEYTSENFNNNNNNNDNNNNDNNTNQNAYIHQIYTMASNGFRPIIDSSTPIDSFHQIQEDGCLRHRAQSTSSTTSSDSVNPVRLIKQRLPPTSTRANLQQNKKVFLDDNSQIPSGKKVFQNNSYCLFYFLLRSNNTE